MEITNEPLTYFSEVSSPPFLVHVPILQELLVPGEWTTPPSSLLILPPMLLPAIYVHVIKRSMVIFVKVVCRDGMEDFIFTEITPHGHYHSLFTFLRVQVLISLALSFWCSFKQVGQFLSLFYFHDYTFCKVMQTTVGWTGIQSFLLCKQKYMLLFFVCFLFYCQLSM